ncbi:uncharacterized protein N7479_005108, partial [Penicillium vulpinum]|uniref:uncharacterized protein n=1 Tax=Penicillium vulpinum TaxID=29845 RepID=UPI002546DF0A
LDLDYIPDIRGNNLPEPIPEQANYISSNLSVVGDFQRELAKRKLSTIEPSDILDSGVYESDSEPSKDLYSRVNKASERAEDPNTTKDTSAISSPFSPPTARSILIYSRARKTPSSKPPVEVPATTKIRTPPIIQYSCVKRGRKGDLQLGHFLTLRNLPFLFYLIALGLYRSAILTVESNTGLKPVYFFTFVPDPSPILPLAYTAVIPLLKHTYTSDKNTLLVRLKEKEAIL